MAYTFASEMSTSDGGTLREAVVVAVVLPQRWMLIGLIPPVCMTWSQNEPWTVFCEPTGFDCTTPIFLGQLRMQPLTAAMQPEPRTLPKCHKTC